MTYYKIDVAALRRLLDRYEASCQGSDDVETGASYDRLSNALVGIAPALLRAVEERDQLLAAAEAVARAEREVIEMNRCEYLGGYKVNVFAMDALKVAVRRAKGE